MKRILNNPEWKIFLKKLDRDSSHWDIFLKKLGQDIQAAPIEESLASPIDKSFFADMPHCKKPSCLLSLLCDFIFFIQKLYSTTNESKGHLTQQTDLKHVIYFIHLLACYLIKYHNPESGTCKPTLTHKTHSIVKDAKVSSLKILREKHALVIENQPVLNAAIDGISSIIIDKDLLTISSYTWLQLLTKKGIACTLLADTDLFDQFSLILRSTYFTDEFKQHQHPPLRFKTQTLPVVSPDRSSKKKQGLPPLLEGKDLPKRNTSEPTSTLPHPIKTMLHQFPFDTLIFFIIAATQIQLIAAQADSFGFAKSATTSDHPLSSFIAFLCFSFVTNLTIKISTEMMPKPQPYPLLLEDKPKLPASPAETVNVEEQKEQRAPLLLRDKPKPLRPDQEKALASVIQQLEDYTSLKLFSWRHHKTAIRNLLYSLKEISNPIDKIEIIVTKLNLIVMVPNGRADRIRQDTTKLQQQILNPSESINAPSAEGLSI